MARKRLAAFTGSAAFVLAVSACGGGATDTSAEEAPAADWAPVKVDVWEELSMDSARSVADYVPLEKADEPWNLCVSVPHMKDAYWLGVAYGATEQAKELGVNLSIVEAGGYENLPTQISQIEDCAQSADA